MFLNPYRFPHPVNIQIIGSAQLAPYMVYNKISCGGDLYFDDLVTNTLHFGGGGHSTKIDPTFKRIKARHIEYNGNLELVDCDINVDVIAFEGSLSFINCRGRIGKIIANGGLDMDGASALNIDSYHGGGSLILNGTSTINKVYAISFDMQVLGNSTILSELWMRGGSLDWSSAATAGLTMIYGTQCGISYSGVLSDISFEIDESSGLTISENISVNSVFSKDSGVTMLTNSVINLINSASTLVLNGATQAVNGKVQSIDPVEAVPTSGQLVVDIDYIENTHVFAVKPALATAAPIFPVESPPADQIQIYADQTGRSVNTIIY